MPWAPPSPPRLPPAHAQRQIGQQVGRVPLVERVGAALQQLMRSGEVLGIVDHGLFVGMAGRVVVASGDGVRVIS